MGTGGGSHRGVNPARPSVPVDLLDRIEADARQRAGPDGGAVTVVLAAENYPGKPRIGDTITGADGDGVLHAGTAVGDDGAVVSAGGRVLSVVGVGADLAAARSQAYERVDKINLPGAHHRSDIGRSAQEGRISIPE